jgi:hypothetical protein
MHYRYRVRGDYLSRDLALLTLREQSRQESKSEVTQTMRQNRFHPPEKSLERSVGNIEDPLGVIGKQ